jgi:uncharacterized protein (DUF2147 family)
MMYGICRSAMLGLTLLLFPLMMMNTRLAAQNADVILGTWYTEDNKAMVEIMKTHDTYTGKIIWIRDSLENGKPRLDKNNPQEHRRSQSLVGLQIIKNLKFENHEWTGGIIYDPESGKEYSCKAALNGENLNLRGYVLGIPFLGRTTTWHRK